MRKVVFEDQTQCSPGYGYWSARGIVYMDSFMRSPLANTIEFISVHSSFNGPPDDPMGYTFPTYIVPADYNVAKMRAIGAGNLFRHVKNCSGFTHEKNCIG